MRKSLGSVRPAGRRSRSPGASRKGCPSQPSSSSPRRRARQRGALARPRARPPPAPTHPTPPCASHASNSPSSPFHPRAPAQDPPFDPDDPGPKQGFMRLTVIQEGGFLGDEKKDVYVGGVLTTTGTDNVVVVKLRARPQRAPAPRRALGSPGARSAPRDPIPPPPARAPAPQCSTSARSRSCATTSRPGGSGSARSTPRSTESPPQSAYTGPSASLPPQARNARRPRAERGVGVSSHASPRLRAG